MKALMRLDPSTYLEKASPIEGYESLIWTERYTGNGEFELVTPAIKETKDLLPEGTLLAVDESREVMMVESREIQKSSEGTASKLVVKGRSFETFLECRGLRNGEAVVGFNRTAATIVLLAIQKNLDNPYVAADDVPNVVSSVATLNKALATEYWRLEDVTDVYSKIVEILNGDGLGIRNIRPDKSGTLNMQIYDGKDRTYDQTTNTKVILDYSAGHLKDPSYLWSNKDYRNIAYVSSPIGFRVVAAPGISTSISGMARRVLTVNASDITDPGTDTVANVLTQRGRLELAKYNKQAIFDGEMAQASPYKYGTHYGLGDKLTAKAQYGIFQDLFVTEFIRNWNLSDGYREFPTLTVV